MFTESFDKSRKARNSVKPLQMLSFLAAVVFTLSIHPAKAHAQIVGDLEVNIPFQFYAGNAKLPAGKYLVRMLDNSDLHTMEISAVDSSTSALFYVDDAEAHSAPAKNELIFNKYGDRYFLAKVFDEGNPDGSAVPQSEYEKRVSQAAAEAQEHVPAHHHQQQQGN